MSTAARPSAICSGRRRRSSSPARSTASRDPQIYLRPQPYKGDFNNPAPNLGVAWNPSKPDGFLGTLLGQSVYRANFGVNYYDEGLINFQTAAGNGPGLSQTLALPPFTPGSLNLQTPLPAYTKTPTTFAFPIAMSGFTFNRGHATIVPDSEDAVRPQLDDRLPARDLARARSKSATSATAATTSGAATTSTRRTSSRTASSTSSRTRSAISRSTSPMAAPASPTRGCRARSRCRSSTPLSGRAARARGGSGEPATPTARSSRSCSRGRPVG